MSPCAMHYVCKFIQETWFYLHINVNYYPTRSGSGFDTNLTATLLPLCTASNSHRNFLRLLVSVFMLGTDCACVGVDESLLSKLQLVA